MISTTSGITLRLFIGCLISSELRMHLAHSSKWKELKFTLENAPQQMQLVHFKKKEYIGHYLDNALLSLKDVAHYEKLLRSALQEICPEYPHEKLTLRIFSQPFIH